MRIRIESLSKRYGRIDVLDGVKLDIAEGKIVAILEIVVIAKHKSTGRGSDDTMWELQKLDRSEPDAALFEIPADYKIVTVTNESQADSPPDSSSKEQSASRP